MKKPNEATKAEIYDYVIGMSFDDFNECRNILFNKTEKELSMLINSINDMVEMGLHKTGSDGEELPVCCLNSTFKQKMLLLRKLSVQLSKFSNLDRFNVYPKTKIYKEIYMTQYKRGLGHE